MRCKACDYPLWNLAARVCPECGGPFVPSDFDFIINSVRFCCPHCSQDYYGTGPRGHLEPAEFDCAKCHRHIHMDLMVLLPTAGVQEEQTETDKVPWLQRAKIGRFKALFRTIGRAMFEPGRLARATPDPGGLGDAWRFCVLSNVGYLIFGAAPIALFPFIIGLAMPVGRRGPGAGFIVGALAIVVVFLIVLAILFPVWGLLTHLILRITGPTRLGPAASVRTLCYASGTNACASIPCLGFYLSLPALIWTGISAALQLRIVQRVGWFRAFLAGLLPPVAVVGSITALFILIIMPRMSATTYRAQASMQQFSALKLAAALSAYRARHNNQFPTHALELMHEGDLVGSDFTTVSTFGAPPPSGVTPPDPILTSFQILDSKQQTAATNAAVASMPPNVIAHRLGNVVFTYHGIDPATGDPKLWVAVEIPETKPPPTTTSNPADSTAGVETVYRFPPAQQTVGIAMLNGATLQIPIASFPTALAKQNKLRADAGLPPLPDPAAIRAGSPATAPIPSK